MPDILVIGSFVVGLTVRVPRKPVVGEGLIGDLFDMGPGGKGANQAIAAARLGAQVDLVACVGDDLFAEMADALFQKEGIASTHIHRVPNINTGVGLVTLLPSGDNWIVGHLGANMQMRPQHVEAAEPLIAGSGIVMAQFEAPLDSIARGLELGRKHGAMTILNPAPGHPADRELLAHVDVLTPNESEARILLGLPPDDPTPTPELAGRLLNLGVDNIVVTRGEEGAVIVTAGGFEEIPAVPVKALDVTGAGDSFNAALAVGLSEGVALRDAVRQATYAGAYTTTHLGVIDGLPTRKELKAFRARKSKGGESASKRAATCGQKAD